MRIGAVGARRDFIHFRRRRRARHGPALHQQTLLQTLLQTSLGEQTNFTANFTTYSFGRTNILYYKLYSIPLWERKKNLRQNLLQNLLDTSLGDRTTHSERPSYEKFAQFSALVYSLYKVTIQRTFENVLPRKHHGACPRECASWCCQT